MSELKNCRSCSSVTELVLDLGELYVSDFVSDNQGLKSPLRLMRCLTCQLVQLTHSVNPDRLYTHFWYQSGISPTMKADLKNIVSEILSTQDLKPGDVVLDIGCNDGTLFDYYPHYVSKVGFEPAKNLVGRAKLHANQVYNEYFNAPTYKRVWKDASVITTIAMFYDLEDPNSFVSDITKCLDEKGIWVNQMNYMPTMIRRNNYDNIVHEHLEYYSLTSLKYLLDRHGLEIFRVELNNVNSGSFRVFAGFPGKYSMGKSVEVYLKMEEELEFNNLLAYQNFKSSVDAQVKLLKDFVQQEVERGKKIYGLGASTRGNTILQYTGLDSSLITAIVDRNAEKWGMKTIGTSIPVIGRHELTEKPDYYLILPYHFLSEFILQEEEYLARGGKFIVPLPLFRVI